MPEKRKHVKFELVDFPVSKNGNTDGSLIARCLIMEHGYDVDRIRRLSRSERDYIETSLCTIIQELCYHLEIVANI